MFGELSEEIRKIAKHAQVILMIGVFLACLAYPLTGLYRVDVNETGVLKRFGEVIDGHVMPGIHYRLPWPIDRVERVGTGDVRRLQAGFGAEKETEQRLRQQLGQFESIEYGTLLVPYCITGDKNIVHLKVIIQYRILDPGEYLFEVISPEEVLSVLVQNIILKSVTSMQVDDVLTTEKVFLQRTIREQLQDVLERLPLGLIVISVDVAKTRPPSAVDQAFRDVVNAQEESTTTIHEAEAYKSRILPEAQALAARMVADARAYRARKIAHAEGEAKRFSLLAAEYEREKLTTGRRLYLQTMVQILPFVRMYVIGSDEGEDIAELRFLLPRQ